MRGEPVEREELRARFATLVGNWTFLVVNQTRLTGFTAGYATFSVVFPTLLVTPAYLVGAITWARWCRPPMPSSASKVPWGTASAPTPNLPNGRRS